MRKPSPARSCRPLPRVESVALGCAGVALAFAGCGPALDMGEYPQPQPMLAQASGADTTVHVQVQVQQSAPPPATFVLAPEPAMVPLETPQIVYVRPADVPSEPVYVAPAQQPVQRPVHYYVPPAQTQPIPVVPAPVPTVIVPNESSIHVRGRPYSVGPAPVRVPVRG